MGSGASVAVVTSVYGDYDPIVPHNGQNIAVEWICVTDANTHVPQPWTKIVEPRPHLHPRMAAKVARCRPDFYTDADYTIWLDAAGRLAHPDAAQRLVCALDGSDIAQFTHPERSDIVAEAEVSEGMRKYHGQSMRAQVDHYRYRGLGSGLWATGCIVRRTTPTVQAFGDSWLVEMMRWSWQDQLSEPYALQLHDLVPVPLPGNLWSNPLVSFDYRDRRRDD